MYGSYGSYGSYGDFGGGGGGVQLPASPSEMLQWLKGLESDGLTLFDKKDVVNPQPEVRDVSVQSFNGSSSYNDYPISTPPCTTLYLSAWVNSGTLDAVNRTAWGEWSAATSGRSWRIYKTSGNFMSSQIRRGGANVSLSSGSAVADTWYFIEVLADTTGTFIYRDGVLKSSNTSNLNAIDTPENVHVRKGGSSDGSDDYKSLIGLCTVTCDGVPLLSTPSEEVGGTISYDISGNSYHGTIVNGARSTGDSMPSSNHSNGFTLLENLYTAVEEPAGTPRTFNPNTATISELADLLGVMIYDVQNTIGTYTITIPTGGWLYTLDPITASIGDVIDACATIASELGATISSYTVTEPLAGWLRDYDYEDDDFGTLTDVLATFIRDVQ